METPLQTIEDIEELLGFLPKLYAEGFEGLKAMHVDEIPDSIWRCGDSPQIVHEQNILLYMILGEQTYAVTQRRAACFKANFGTELLRQARRRTFEIRKGQIERVAYLPAIQRWRDFGFEVRRAQWLIARSRSNQRRQVRVMCESFTTMYSRNSRERTIAPETMSLMMAGHPSES